MRDGSENRPAAKVIRPWPTSRPPPFRAEARRFRPPMFCPAPLALLPSPLSKPSPIASSSRPYSAIWSESVWRRRIFLAAAADPGPKVRISRSLPRTPAFLRLFHPRSQPICTPIMLSFAPLGQCHSRVNMSVKARNSSVPKSFVPRVTLDGRVRSSAFISRSVSHQTLSNRE